MNTSREEYLFHQGTNYRAYNYLGLTSGKEGYTFRVWAPNAESVYLCGDFNGWDDSLRMNKVTKNGVYEYSDKRGIIKAGDKYKYKIINNQRLAS